MLKDYRLTRKMLVFLQIAGWALVGLGTLVFLIAISEQSSSGFVPFEAVRTIIGGFGLVVSALIGGAIIDIAETNQRILYHSNSDDKYFGSSGSASAPINTEEDKWWRK